MPRVFCYFDDIVGSETELYNDYTGERLAINEFNPAHETKKLATAYHFLAQRIPETWHQQIFIYHDFAHSRYNDFVSDSRGTVAFAAFVVEPRRVGSNMLDSAFRFWCSPACSWISSFDHSKKPSTKGPRNKSQSTRKVSNSW